MSAIPPVTAPPTCALIDMDGTLYDSMPLHAEAWARTCRRLGLGFSHSDFFLMEGRTGVDTLRILFSRMGRPVPGDDELRSFYQLKTRFFRELPPPPPMPGAARMLRHLADAGIDRVLVTGSGQSSLIDRLDSDFPGAFAKGRKVTSADVIHGKPHPEPFLRAMQLAGVTAAQCMVIENAPLGVEAGRASGAFTIGVNTGPLPPSALADAGAHIVFPSMEAFADALPRLIEELRR